MPATRLKKRSSPISVVSKNSQQINGLYVHSSPPKVLQVHPSIIRQWIRAGDIGQLEQVVLQGQGHKLIGEYSPDPKVRTFLKQVPAYMVKISQLHEAMGKGDLKQLEKLMEVKNPDSPMRNILMSKNLAGVGLLHKAAYYGYPKIVELIVSNFPQTVNMKDKEGKTALHYCGASKEAGKIWPMLLKAGADTKIMDSKGKLPSYYMERANEIQLPDDRVLTEMPVSSSTSKNSLIIKPSNIRIWIHDRDLGKLQQVIWEGHGGKLRVETSNHPRVKRFLEGVPHVLNVIKDVHSAVVNDDFEEFVKKSSDPVPVEILQSKDVNGLNPLHKAAGLGRTEIAREILKRNPKLIFSVDHEGRTPLHYAAALKDNNAMYNLLVANNANEMLFDKNGKVPSYYKANSKEISNKVLEVIPEAPRTPNMFPQTWDWVLFQQNTSAPTTLTSITNVNPSLNMAEPEKSSRFRKEPIMMNEHKPKDVSKLNSVKEPEQSKPEEQINGGGESEGETLPAKHESEKSKEQEVSELVKETQEFQSQSENVNFDIWTNDVDEKKGQNEGEEKKSENAEDFASEENNNTDDENSKTESVQKQNEIENSEIFENLPEEKGTPNESNLNEKEILEKIENREKTEREIAEERQRLLDEGLIKINSDDDDDDDDNADDDETNEEDKEIKEIVERGDMEKMASMVLNGEGDKLLGKTAKNPEVQSFLDNLPSYMAKITAVHKAARNGSLRDLQGALDRRKFAVAKESSDPLGVTPLHTAVLFEKPQIVKYLGGRFPETLHSKDNFGRTPLHYAALLRDDGNLFNILLNLGADKDIMDDDGHTAGHYQENPGKLSQQYLLQQFDAPAHIAKDMLADQENPLFGSDGGKYLANALGGPLVRGLTEIANKRPRSPIAYLANFLYDFLNKCKGVSSPVTDPSLHNVEPEQSFDEGLPLSKQKAGEEVDEGSNDDDSPSTNFTVTDRDEYGQSVLHFAAARAHGRSGLFQLIHESNVNLGYRDELYRTARDIALQANLPENVSEIDKYVISLAAAGETEKLMELFLEGYDHILDLEDDEDNDIISVASKTNQEKTVAFLRAIPLFEDKREQMHKAIRAGEDRLVQDIIQESKNGRFIIIGKNSSGKCSLHIAVLCQQKEITEFIAQKFPETLRIGDNLERTPLHYAMGVEEVETLSKILIKCGAKRVLKDLKGRQPTYYFMNKSEILKLQQEENPLRA